MLVLLLKIYVAEFDIIWWLSHTPTHPLKWLVSLTSVLVETDKHR